VDDYSAWIITIVFIVAILIILFLFFSPSKQPLYKQPKRKSELRYKKAGDRFAAGKSSKGRRVSKDVKFIELDEEDVIPEDYDEDEEMIKLKDREEKESEEDVEDVEDVDDIDDDSIYEVKRRRSKNRGKRRKKPVGLFAGLFSGGSRARNKYTIKKKQRDRNTRNKEKIRDEMRKKSRTKSDRSISKKEIKDNDEDVAVVQVIGEGGLDEDEYYSDDEAKEFEEKESSRSKRKQKPRGKDRDKYDDMSWEYSQLIGIR
jgi:hypothetical protein